MSSSKAGEGVGAVRHRMQPAQRLVIATQIGLVGVPGLERRQPTSGGGVRRVESSELFHHHSQKEHAERPCLHGVMVQHCDAVVADVPEDVVEFPVADASTRIVAAETSRSVYRTVRLRTSRFIEVTPAYSPARANAPASRRVAE